VAQCSNAIVHLDEFKNNIDLDKREFLKGLWDSAGRTRMNMDRDKKREQTKVDAGVIISGQEMATADIALFSRFVYLTFNKTEFTQNERNRFNELDNLRKLGFTHLTLQILNLREIFKQNFAQMFNQTVSEVMNRLGDDTCESRIINNWVTLAAAFRTVEQYLDLPFTYNDYLKITVDGIKNQNDSCKSSDELASFWQAFVAAAQGNDKKRQCIPDYDYRFDYKIQFTGDNGVGVTWMDQHALLAINPDSYYAIYQVKMKEFAQVSLNRKSLEHYLINSKQYLGKKLLRFKVGEGSSAKRALWFDYEELQKAYDLDLEVEFKELD